MTFVGRILVFVITALSLVFMAFAVTVYSTRTNWLDKYKAEVAKLEDANKKKASLEQQLKTLSEVISEEVGKHKTERDTALIQIKAQQKDYEGLLKDYKQARDDAVRYEAQLKQATDLAVSRREEALRLREIWKKTQEEKDLAMKKQFETEQALIELKYNYETTLARLKDVEGRAAELTAVLESYGFPTTSKERQVALLTNPPPVEGIVTKVDPQGKYIELSVGSDHGLLKGHKLQVYREKPQGKYVGMVQITEVDPEKSVARVLPQFKQANIQEGDLVANRITASR